VAAARPTIRGPEVTSFSAGPEEGGRFSTGLNAPDLLSESLTGTAPGLLIGTLACLGQHAGEAPAGGLGLCDKAWEMRRRRD
jgi:hypothetical protein